MKRIELPSINCEKVSKEIGDFILEVVSAARATGCVIGLSGGVDSSTTAALVKAAFDRHETTKAKTFELVGYIIPSDMNNPVDTADARTVAGILGIRSEVIDIEPLVRAFETTNPEALRIPYHKGNLISRIRANVLSTKAATEKKSIAGTGNKDEDFGIGYYTLFGDGAVHMSPIGGLSKRLVREMAEYLGLPDHIVRRTPTAGLEPDQSDFKDLGYDYDVVELVTEGLDQGLTLREMENHDQVRPLVDRQIKRYASRFKRQKFDSAEALLKDICRRHVSAAAKMKIIHPPSPRISLSYA